MVYASGIIEVRYYICMNEKVLWHIQSLWEEALKKHPKEDTLTQSWDHISQRFTQVTHWDPCLSPQPVMSDEAGEYHGLFQDVYLFGTSITPIYIFDNHHKALFAFLDSKENTGQILPVVHIDAHPDDAPSAYSEGIIFEENINKAYSQSRICDFLDTAEKGGLIRETMRVVTSAEFERFSPPDGPFILSLDIDIFGPEGGYIELDQKIKTIARAWQQAVVITIATSPGFIDQEYAWKIIKSMLGLSEDVL